jgi:hypothetical protein
MPQNDPTIAKSSIMFPLEDAEKSFDNALVNNGYNPYLSNPFVSSLKRSARGLRQSFIQDRAQRGNGSYATDYTPSQDFQQYLTDQLRGGNIQQTLSQSARNLPNAITSVRNYQYEMGQGAQNAQNANPYLQLLSDELSANEGQGTANALTYLRAPLMGANLGKAYSSMLGDVVSSANRSLAEDPATYLPGNTETPGANTRDIWSYIFGSRGANGGPGSPF